MFLGATAFCISLAAQSSDRAIVARFYPKRFVNEIASEDLVRTFRYVRADLDGVGKNNYMLVNEQVFRKQSRTMDIPVTLAARNEIFVMLRSKPGSEITVSLSKAKASW